jgi:peptidoglycan DL-endopeptidase RipA
MSERAPSPDDELRLAELLRVNAELAVEIRDLKLGRTSAPRPSQLAAARQVAKLQAERDALAAERDALAAEAAQLEAAKAELGEVEAVRDDLLRHKAEQEAEIARLRRGFAGLLRRGLARLRRS